VLIFPLVDFVFYAYEKYFEPKRCGEIDIWVMVDQANKIDYINIKSIEMHKVVSDRTSFR
jgi:hypothetical protein